MRIYYFKIFSHILASNCNAYNHREDFVQQLNNVDQAYHWRNDLDIDIFGKCGTLELSREPSVEISFKNNIANTYKFYLALENSNCEDYISEKFYFALKHGIIPIVMGGLFKSDFKYVAPPHSYIHVEDYDSVDDLMRYLGRVTRPFMCKNTTL